MIKGWIIYPEYKSNNAYDWMRESAAKFDIELDVVFADKLVVEINALSIKYIYNGGELSLPHFVIMRHYDFFLSQSFESYGVKVYNSTQSMINSQNKLSTHLLLSKNSIPTPETLYNEVDFNVITEKIGLPFVMKPITGSKGERVFLVADHNGYLDALSTMEGDEWIAQKYISSSSGRDIRVWVIGDKVVGQVLRQNKKSFRSNIADGGNAYPIELTPTIAEIAIKSCKALGLELGGVDILFDNDTYSVCEVNGNAGFRAFSMSGEAVDIPFEIFSHIFNQY